MKENAKNKLSDAEKAIQCEASRRLASVANTLKMLGGNVRLHGFISVGAGLDCMLSDGMSKQDVMQAVSDMVNMRCSFPENNLTQETGEKMAKWTLKYPLNKS